MISAPDITLAQPGDARAVSELSRDAIEYGLSWRWTERRVTRSVRDPDTNVAVLRRDGALLGFAIMNYGDEDAHVVLFAVRADQRRGGIGSALLRWLEETAAVAGIRTLRLEVRAGNEAARAFYAHHGFVDSGGSPGYYEGVEDAVRMVKELWPAPKAGSQIAE